MADPVQSYRFARENLAENMAKQVQVADKTLINDNQITRRWIKIPSQYVDECLEFLRLYASAKNPKQGHTVLDPMVEKETCHGLYRRIEEHSETNIHPGNSPGDADIFQTLKKGWITAIDTDASKWTEAQWVKNDSSQQIGNTKGDSERYLHVVFKNVSPQHLGAIAATLNVATFVNPVVFGETVTGTFRNLGVVPRTEQDGSGVVEIIMGDPDYQLTAFTNLSTPKEHEVIYLYGVAKDLAQGINATWKALGVKGSTITTHYYRDQHLVDLILRKRVSESKVEVTGIISAWDCRYKSTEDQHYGLTQAEANVLVLTEPPAGEVWRCDKRFDQEDGTWTVIIEKTVRSEQTVAVHTSLESDAVKVETDELIGTTTPTTELLIPEETGKLKRRVVTKNADCSSDVKRDVSKGKEQTTTTKIISPAGTTTIFEKTFQGAALDDPVLEKGHIKQVVSKASDYHAKFDTTASDKVPTDQESDDGADTGFVATARHHHTENPAFAGDPPPGGLPEVEDSEVGTRTRLDAYPTEAGNLRTTEVIETSKHVSVAEFISRYSERETEYLSEEYHDHDPPEIENETGNGIDTAVVAHHFDDFLTHHFKVARIVRKFPFEGEVSWITRGEVQYETIQTYSETLGRYWNSMTKLFRWKQTHYIKFFKTAAEAAAYITSTGIWDDPTGAWHNEGSFLSHTGPHEWLGHKVNRTKGYFHTYEYVEPVD